MTNEKASGNDLRRLKTCCQCKIEFVGRSYMCAKCDDVFDLPRLSREISHSDPCPTNFENDPNDNGIRHLEDRHND